MPGVVSQHGFTLSFVFFYPKHSVARIYHASSLLLPHRPKKRRSLCLIVTCRQLHDLRGSFVGRVGHPHPAHIARGEGSLNQLMLLWLRESVVCVRICCDGTSFKSCRFFEGSADSVWRIGRHTLRFFPPYPVQLLQYPDS